MRKVGGDHVPLVGRPHREECDEDGQCGRRGRQGLLWQGEHSIPSGEQAGDCAGRRGDGEKSEKPERQVENSRKNLKIINKIQRLSTPKKGDKVSNTLFI